jgi:hypothetical protein
VTPTFTAARRAGTGGRSVAPKPLDGRKLGPTLLAKARRQKYETSLFGMGVMVGPDLQHFVHATRSVRSFAYAAGRVARHGLDMLFSGRGMRFVNGAALVGRLMKSAHKLGVARWVSSAATRLLQDDGAVRGAQVETAGTVRFAHGAASSRPGGFAHDATRRASSSRAHRPPRMTTGCRRNRSQATGCDSARRSADRSTAALRRPWHGVPYRSSRIATDAPACIRTSSIAAAGIIGVLADGRRFVNEATVSRLRLRDAQVRPARC